MQGATVKLAGAMPARGENRCGSQAQAAPARALPMPNSAYPSPSRAAWPAASRAVQDHRLAVATAIPTDRCP